MRILFGCREICRDDLDKPVVLTLKILSNNRKPVKQCEVEDEKIINVEIYPVRCCFSQPHLQTQSRRLWKKNTLDKIIDVFLILLFIFLWHQEFRFMYSRTCCWWFWWINKRIYFFFDTPTVRPRRPVVFVCWPRTRRPQ